MRNVLEAIWWWVRLIVLCLIGAYVLGLLFKNSGQSATLWYWPYRAEVQTSLITVIAVSFLSGGISFLLAYALISAMITYRRTRDARRERLEAERRAEVERKARMLRVKPAPTPVVRTPPAPAEPRTRTIIPPVSLEPAPEPDEVEAPEPAAEVAPLPMPPVPAAARPSEPGDGVPATGVDLSEAPEPLVSEPAPAPVPTPPRAQSPRDERAERILGIRLPPPAPPPAGG